MNKNQIGHRLLTGMRAALGWLALTVALVSFPLTGYAATATMNYVTKIEYYPPNKYIYAYYGSRTDTINPALENYTNIGAMKIQNVYICFHRKVAAGLNISCLSNGLLVGSCNQTLAATCLPTIARSSPAGSGLIYITKEVPVNTELCVSMVAGGFGTVMTTATYWAPTSSAACDVPVTIVPDVSCKFTNEAITLDYGTQNISNLNVTKSQGVTLTCSGAASVKFTLQSGATSIALSNGMKSTITFDNKALGTALSIATGTTSHTVTSTLSGTPKTGTFSGSGVLVMAVQ